MDQEKIERLLLIHGHLDFVVDDAETHISSCGLEHLLGDDGSYSEDGNGDGDSTEVEDHLSCVRD